MHYSIFRHKVNEQLYQMLKVYYTGAVVVEPYNRGYNEEDKKLLFRKDGMRKRVNLKNFERVGYVER